MVFIMISDDLMCMYYVCLYALLRDDYLPHDVTLTRILEEAFVARL